MTSVIRPKKLRPLAVILVTGVVLGVAGCTTSSPYGESVRHARTIVEEYMATTGVPALQIAVAVDGRIVWSEAFGVADRSSGRLAAPQSRFRIASVSKLLTGTLTAKLADAGVLDLDRPIGEYVADLPAAWHDITARMLAHHTSGIAHYADEQDGLDSTYYLTTRAALSRFKDRPLVHPPGQDETYSSYAYTVLALVIEQAIGQPFLEVMQQQILQPLGMLSTGPDLQSSPRPERTGFYNLAEDGSVVDAPYLDLSGRWAGSGYLSTAEDLVRFGMAHASQGPLSAGTRALVAQRDSLADGSLTKEGFGWGPRSDWDGRPMLWGDGSTPGSRCGLLVYPDDGLVIAILTNARGLALERGEFQTLARLFLGPRQGLSLPPPTQVAGNWTGSVAVGEVSIDVHLEVERSAVGGSGRASFTGWRSFTIADMFQLGDTTWLVTLDRQGLFPITITLAGDSMNATAPRADWSFRLARSTTDLQDGR
jgi:CubicO group peptidase (beta-lactamase class C family)